MGISQSSRNAPRPGVMRCVRATARRLPLTIALLGAMLVAGWWGGTMFHPIADNPALLRRVGYGVDALREGHFWTLLTSILFTWKPWMLQTIALSVVLFVLPLELLAGSRRALITFLGSHVAGYVMTSVVVTLPAAALGIGWGTSFASVRDVGASAGAFGCAAALTWFLPRRWTRPAQVALAAYLGYWLVTTHWIWDIEHAVAALTGYGLGRFWAGSAGTEGAIVRARQAGRPWDRRRIRQTMAALVAVTGLTNLVSVLLAGTDRTVPGWVNQIPGAVLNGSRSFVVLAGFLLILLGRGLAQGRRTAWLAALLLLEGSAIAHTLKGLHLQEAAIASIAAVLLATQIEAFRVQPDRPSLTRAGRSIAGLAGGFLVYAVIGLYLFRGEFSPAMGSREAIEELLARLVFLSSNAFTGDTERARWFLGSLSLVWVAFVIYAAVVLLRPRLKPGEIALTDRARVEEILRERGRTTTSPMTLWPGITAMLSADRQGYLGYRLVGDVALALGDPIGPAETIEPLIDEFLALCATSGWTPCFYAVTPAVLTLFPGRDLATIQVGEDAIVPLASLAFTGKRWQDVRTAMNKAAREGVRFEWFDQATGDRRIQSQLWEISRAWLEEKGLPEMGFTLGKLTETPEPSIRTAVALDESGMVHGFVTWLPVYAAHGWVIDLMRRRPGGMRGVMEFLIARSAMALRDEGFDMISLATAPLARVDRPGEDVTVLQRGLSLIAQRLDAFYHIGPLFEFKRKFDPAWSPVYLAYPGFASLPKITLAIVRAYLPGLGVPELAAQIGATAVALPRRWHPSRPAQATDPHASGAASVIDVGGSADEPSPAPGNHERTPSPGDRPSAR